MKTFKTFKTDFQPSRKKPKENFPVASLFMPQHLREPILVIYAFAREADDFADEGNLTVEERYSKLDHYVQQLKLIENNQNTHDPLFNSIAEIIELYQMPIQYFFDLLTAFRQDVEKNRYAHFGEVMMYCKNSANPIGRMLLRLYQADTERNLAYSDAICSALQLINFLQDIDIDYRTKNRIYMPQDELEKYKITEEQIANHDTNGLWAMFMSKQIERARKLLQSGAPLGLHLKGMIGLEMRLIIAGGESILKKLHKHQGDIYNHRPELKLPDYGFMLKKAIFKR